MNTYIGNPTAEHLRDMAAEYDRTCGSNVSLAAVTGALRTGAAEIDRLQKQLTEILSKVTEPTHFL